jgi:hypothetical protein
VEQHASGEQCSRRDKLGKLPACSKARRWLRAVACRSATAASPAREPKTALQGPQGITGYPRGAKPRTRAPAPIRDRSLPRSGPRGPIWARSNRPQLPDRLLLHPGVSLSQFNRALRSGSGRWNLPFGSAPQLFRERFGREQVLAPNDRCTRLTALSAASNGGAVATHPEGARVLADHVGFALTQTLGHAGRQTFGEFIEQLIE